MPTIEIPGAFANWLTNGDDFTPDTTDPAEVAALRALEQGTRRTRGRSYGLLTTSDKAAVFEYIVERADTLLCLADGGEWSRAEINGARVAIERCREAVREIHAKQAQREAVEARRSERLVAVKAAPQSERAEALKHVMAFLDRMRADSFSVGLGRGRMASLRTDYLREVADGTATAARAAIVLTWVETVVGDGSGDPLVLFAPYEGRPALLTVDVLALLTRDTHGVPHNPSHDPH